MSIYMTGRTPLAALLWFFCAPAWGDPVVTYAVTPNAGAFMYDLTLNNTNSTLIVSGLIVVNGSTVFGLDSSSPISAPPEANGCPCLAWGFAPPIPPFGNPLEYFSPNVNADISPGPGPNAILPGFSFTSFTNPSSLKGNDFDIILVVRGGTTFKDIGNAVPVPEGPSLFMPLLLATATIVVVWLRRSATLISR
jgi:hypothetical protein